MLEEQDSLLEDHEIQRRVAQNCEAARKNQLQKKVDETYVQHLESSRLKLVQLERELEWWSRRFSVGFSGPVDSDGHWVEEQNRQICELRSALEGDMSHYFELFRMKYAAAQADIFYVMSGMWKTAAECFFFWVKGFHPFELLKHADDALSQGMEKLQSTLAETVAAGQLVGGYIPQIPTASLCNQVWLYSGFFRSIADD
ncbi:hypothetical protein Pint_26716 [Pistacia integerrima]|uniref:Uncharacterized protein n=1 Tax=Pistacia integerrima TaxID=434235 RepID=A0ACC0YPP7_9ROSI|nr:hypothetical protein Pint_26716 [Pistacia integerrima]